jgi:hypothetical protein
MTKPLIQIGNEVREMTATNTLSIYLTWQNGKHKKTRKPPKQPHGKQS